MRNLFDEKISKLVNGGKNREAIEFATKFAAHAVAASAGIYFGRLANPEAALKFMKLAVDIDPNNPDFYGSLVHLLCESGDYEGAYKYGTVGIGLSDAKSDTFYNHGITCQRLDLLEEAAEVFRKAIAINPSSAKSHYQLGCVLLPLGYYEEGFREDEWRMKALEPLRVIRGKYKQNDWDGKVSLKGKKILVYNEQGQGDAIQFSRYITKFKELGAKVIFEVSPELYNLYASFSPVDVLVKQGDSLPKHDYVVSVNSLPYFFDPRLDNISTSSYLVPTKSEEVDGMKELATNNLKVGIVWAGSSYQEIDSTRSCFLNHFDLLGDVPGVTLFSLQQGDMIRDWDGIVNLAEGSSLKFVDLGPRLKDFNYTACVLQKLDLLISVDTSVAHLAGALGVPVWLLLPYLHDWRWREKWYDSMKIMRQDSPGDWDGLLGKVAVNLAQLAGKA